MRAYNEEKMLPLLRAKLASRLVRKGYRVNHISGVLNVTPAAVTQYLKGVRGRKMPETENQKQIVDTLAEKAAQKINGDMGPLSTVELLDVIHQVLTVKDAETTLQTRASHADKTESITTLKSRLRLELRAAEKCLALANRIQGDYTRLLLRMIASDSVRHADIVSQIISYLETETEIPDEGPDREPLREILAIEDNADELSLRSAVKINNRVAGLLLESIDMDERKHDKILAKMVKNLERKRERSAAQIKAA